VDVKIHAVRLARVRVAIRVQEHAREHAALVVRGALAVEEVVRITVPQAARVDAKPPVMISVLAHAKADVRTIVRADAEMALVQAVVLVVVPVGVRAAPHPAVRPVLVFFRLS
jgi:hypothetical protein